MNGHPKELVQELERLRESYSRAQTMVVSSDSSLRRLTPQWSRRVLSEGCSTPATPRLQGANRRSSGETLRQGRIGASPRNVGWSRAWTMRTGEPSRTQALSALTKQKKGSASLSSAFGSSSSAPLASPKNLKTLMQSQA